MRQKSVFMIAGLIACCCLVGCDQKKDNNVGVNEAVKTPGQPALKVKLAVAKVFPLKGHEGISGTVTFQALEGSGKGVKVIADFIGLKEGKHGFHIHEKGVCEGDGTSAGAHFNPLNKKHGAPANEDRHMGDMGNIEADSSGRAHLEYVDTTIELDGPNSIIGKSVILHEKEDDLHTQPSGDAGGRVACGIIETSVSD